MLKRRVIDKLVKLVRAGYVMPYELAAAIQLMQAKSKDSVIKYGKEPDLSFLYEIRGPLT